MIILKVTRKQGFTLSLEDTFFEKPQEEGQIDRPTRFKVKNYIMLDKICISPSMCLQNDYIRVVLRDY